MFDHTLKGAPLPGSFFRYPHITNISLYNPMACLYINQKSIGRPEIQDNANNPE